MRAWIEAIVRRGALRDADDRDYRRRHGDRVRHRPRLARQGDAVVLASRNLERLEAARERLEAEGGRCSVAALDVRDGEAVNDLIDSLPEIDGLVNNAAGNFVAPTVELSTNGFRAVTEINQLGCFHCSSALARRLEPKGARA